MLGYKKQIGNNEISIGIAHLPQRTKPCLVVQRGNVMTKYASFNNDYSAQEFMNIFAGFIGAERYEWGGEE